MKKVKICTFAILFIMSMALLAACSRKDSGTSQSQSASPSSSSQGTSGANQGGGNESGANGLGTSNSTNGDTGNAGTRESSKSSQENKNGADEESSTGVIGGMIDDVEDGVDDMLGGDSASRGTDENK